MPGAGQPGLRSSRQQPPSMCNHRNGLDRTAADYIAQHEKAAIESIQTSATEGAMTGSAASKKQPIFEQLSFANIFTLHWRNDPAGDPQPPETTRAHGLGRNGRERGRKFSDRRGYPNEPARCRSAPAGPLRSPTSVLTAWDPISLPPVTTVVVLPFVMPAIGGCRGGVPAVLAQHVAPVGYPRV